MQTHLVDGVTTRQHADGLHAVKQVFKALRARGMQTTVGTCFCSSKQSRKAEDQLKEGSGSGGTWNPAVQP